MRIKCNILASNARVNSACRSSIRPVATMRHQFEMPLLFTILLVILINIQATAQQQQVLYRGADHRSARFSQQANAILDATPFLREKVEDLMECTFSCLQHAQCFSFNMAVKAVENKYDCLLLDTSEFKSRRRLTSSKDYNHYSIAATGRKIPHWEENAPTTPPPFYTQLKTFSQKSTGTFSQPY